MMRDFVRRSSLFGVVVSVVVVLLLPAARASHLTMHPPVVEEAQPGLRGFFFSLGCCYFNYAEAGYSLKEYLVSGTAHTYTNPPTTAPYKTRIIVAIPNDPAKFNGTVLVEWENVTAQVPAEPGMVWAHTYILRQGYAYVAVNAQKVGADFLRRWDPIRYGAVSHPGDNYSYDIFSQAVEAIRNPIRLDPIAGLNVERVIGYGQSQSAGRLNSYVNLAQNDANVVDAMIIQADGGERKSFPTLQIPLIHFETEDAIHSTPPDPANDPDLYRLWEVVGTAHVGNEETQSLGSFTLPLNQSTGTPISWELDQQYWEHSHYGEEGPSLGLTCAGGIEMPMRYALDAAIDALHRWLIDGTPIPQPPRASFDAGGNLLFDEHGNAMGGLRLPPIVVPVATYNTSTCSLLGTTVPFTPEKLLGLYPTHEGYVAQMNAAIDDALSQGIMVDWDADQMRRKVDRSLIPIWRPSTQLGN